MIELGREYVDKITGFKGTCTGHCAYLSGCNQTLLIPKVGKDGAHKEGHWFDDQRIEPTKKTRVILNNTKTPGFDMEAPKR